MRENKKWEDENDKKKRGLGDIEGQQVRVSGVGMVGGSRKEN